jgi:hypothetical protein
VWCYVDEITLRHVDRRWMEIDLFNEAGLGYMRDHVEADGDPNVDEGFVLGRGFPPGRWATEMRPRRATADLSADRIAQIDAFPGWRWGDWSAARPAGPPLRVTLAIRAQACHERRGVERAGGMRDVGDAGRGRRDRGGELAGVVAHEVVRHERTNGKQVRVAAMELTLPNMTPVPVARPLQTPTMITRLWRGWTTVDNADAYERFLVGQLFPAMRAIPGFHGADILRRTEHDEVAFITLTRFDSVAAIQAFAGDDYETPVLEPEALALLTRYERRALHFETATFSA